jgi:Ca-activated chloride channel family protein
MQLSTKLDCDLVAVEQADELTLLVELTAPTPETTVTRQPATLQVVLDRSGSMAGDRLEGAKSALLALIDRLDPTDNFGLVAFDTSVQVVVPAGPLMNKPAVKAAIASVDDGGSTDLSSGYLRGLQEARRVAGPAGATVLIVSDGHANAGVTDPDQLGKVAVEAQTHRITTSTFGFGLGYDERLLAALARGGAGNELFAEEADTAVALISGEVEGLLTQVAQAASLRVMWTPHVAGIQVLNDLPVVGLGDGAMLELGSFYAGETRRLLVKFHIPGIAALGLAQVATLEFMHVSLPDLVQHTTMLPVHVNVVPGDQAAGRVPDPVVRSEALFQETQKAKRESSRLLSQGDVAGASHLLRATSRKLRSDAMTLPVAMRADLDAEAQVIEGLAVEAGYDSARAAKASSMLINPPLTRTADDGRESATCTTSPSS